MNAEGSDLQRVRKTPFFEGEVDCSPAGGWPSTRAGDGSPDRSPDGDGIAFVPRFQPRKPGSGELYAVSVDGTCLTGLTRNQAAEGGPACSRSARP